jgi:ABC-type branched-subunit amino acid transport system substrate-binding protein
VLCACLLASACTDSTYQEGAEKPTTLPSQDAFAVDPGVLGDNANVSGTTNSALAGMRGVAPAQHLSGDFRAKILATDPGISSLSGAPEGYDSVVLIALAAEEARSDAPGRIADRIVDLTRSGKRCSDFRSCRRSIESEVDVDYFGQSGGIQMQPNGDPGEGGFGTIEFTSAGTLRTGPVTAAQAPPSQAPAPLVDINAAPAGDGKLRLGFLLPTAGPDGDVARAAQAGAMAAVNEINSAGGVLGDQVQVEADETGDGSPNAVNAAVDKLLAGGVDAVIGGTNFDIDRVAVGRLTAAGIVVVSPTDTNRALSILSDRGLFFRLAAPDDLEGQVLGTLVANDGFTTTAIVTSPASDELDNAADVTAAISSTGGKVVATITAGAGAGGDPAAVASKVIDSAAQSVVLVTSAALAAPIIKALIERGKGPSSFAIYGTSSNMTKELVTLVGAK